MRTRRWRFFYAGWLSIVVQVVLLAGLFAVGRATPLESVGGWRPFALLMLVGITSTVWTFFFYAQDRRTPEPARFVVASFLAGMAAASVFALPIERDIFETETWLYRSPALLVVGATLIRGTLASILLYAIIRYGLSLAHQFNEPVDGMVYGAFAGSGFATITSLTYLVGHPDFTLFAMGYTAATNILMYASVGSLVGYLVGRSKFVAGAGVSSHVLALVVGAALTGLHHTAVEYVLLTGGPYVFWVSFGVSVALSAATLAGTTAIMHRLEKGPAPRLVAAHPPSGRAVWICALVLLVVGGVVKQRATRDVTVTRDGVSFQYPVTQLQPAFFPGTVAGLSPQIPVIFAGSGSNGLPFTIAVGSKEEEVDVSAIHPAAYIGIAEPLSLTIDRVTIGGQAGARIRVSYLNRGEPARGDLPDVVWLYTDVVPSRGHTYVFTFEATPASFRQHEDLYQRILDSVRWTGR